MIRTLFAMAVAAVIFATVSGTSQAAPMAPMSGATSTDNGQLVKVYWHHRHCWRGRWGRLHCGW